MNLLSSRTAALITPLRLRPSYASDRRRVIKDSNARNISQMTLTILHAEDDALVADAVRLTLEAEGWRVVTCPDGAAALSELTGPADYDVLITDQELPHLGGIDLICCAHMLRHRVRLRVVMLTAADCEREARRVGVDAFLRKPEGVGELVPTVRRLLRGL